MKKFITLILAMIMLVMCGCTINKAESEPDLVSEMEVVVYAAVESAEDITENMKEVYKETLTYDEFVKLINSGAEEMEVDISDWTEEVMENGDLKVKIKVEYEDSTEVGIFMFSDNMLYDAYCFAVTASI